MVAQRTLVHNGQVQGNTTKGRERQLHLIKGKEPLEESVRWFDRAIRRVERIEKKARGRPRKKEIKPLVTGSTKYNLVEKNHWAAVWYAKLYWHPEYKKAGIQFDDLVQAAREGMIRATDKYRKSKGNKFLTYAVPWMKCYIMKELRQNGIVHIPPASMRSTRDTLRAIEAIEKGSCADGLNKLARERYELFRKKPGLIENRKKHAERATAAIRNVKKVSSIDVAKRNEEGETRYSQIPCDARTDDRIRISELVAVILKNIGHLRQMEREVITRRAYTDDSKSLDELGKEYGVSRERIRQIEARALAKLRESKELADYAPSS